MITAWKLLFGQKHAYVTKSPKTPLWKCRKVFLFFFGYHFCSSSSCAQCCLLLSDSVLPLSTVSRPTALLRLLIWHLFRLRTLQPVALIYCSWLLRWILLLLWNGAALSYIIYKKSRKRVARTIQIADLESAQSTSRVGSYACVRYVCDIHSSTQRDPARSDRTENRVETCRSGDKIPSIPNVPNRPKFRVDSEF